MRFQVYQDAGGEWRWTLLADNGEPVADSGEGYQRYADCSHAIDLIKAGVPAATVEVKGRG